jgi:hypothetical protein
MQLKLGLKPPTQDSIAEKLQQLRAFSSDQNVAIIATDPNGGDPGVTCVTFEFEIAGDEVYHAVGEQCVAWLDEADASGVVVYAMIRDKPLGGC